MSNITNSTAAPATVADVPAPRLNIAPSGPLANPAKAGADAARADDAQRDALRTAGKPVPAALTGTAATTRSPGSSEIKLRASSARAARVISGSLAARTVATRPLDS